MPRPRAERISWTIRQRERRKNCEMSTAEQSATGLDSLLEQRQTAEVGSGKESMLDPEDKESALSSESSIAGKGDTRYKSLGQEEAWHIQGGKEIKSHCDSGHGGGGVESEVGR